MPQWFASPGTKQAHHFTPIVTGFTPTQSMSVLVMDTPVSRSLGATFSELTGQPIPSEFRVLPPTTAALVTGTTEMNPSSVASSEPPLTVTPTLDISATVKLAVVAPLFIVTPSEPQGQATTLASTSQLADPVTETAEQTPTLRFWCLTPKGEREHVC